MVLRALDIASRAMTGLIVLNPCSMYTVKNPYLQGIVTGWLKG